MDSNYKSIYKAMIDKYQNESLIKQGIGFSGFRIGDLYNETKIMVCGRATNGTECSYTRSRIIKKSDEILGMIETEQNQLYFDESIKSPFLNIAKHIIVTKYQKKASEWYRYILWTNLMKISPSSGGNPGDRDWAIQKEHCMKLFKYEIDIYKPRNIIMLTGFDWAFDFLEFLDINPNITVETKYDRIVVGKYKYVDSNIIIAKGPESINREKFCYAISNYLE